MPKKRPADERGGGAGRAAKLPRRYRQHLYIVLNDWEKGYSIRKLDLSSDNSDSDGVVCSRTEQCLPPSVLRLEAPHACSGLFTAFGTRIMAAMHHTPNRRSALMFDVRTRALTFAPRHKDEPSSLGGAAYVQVNGKLLLLDAAGFEMLDPPPPTPSPSDEQSDVKVRWKWENLPRPPTSSHKVISYAVHPDERTVFLSTKKYTQKHTKVSTLFFDTVSREWSRLQGEWLLPFKGRGYFDPELDAWIGLSRDPNTLGHICACEIIIPADDNSNGGGGKLMPPLSKVTKEKLFCIDPAEKHIGATLVYMGGRSMFCLLQCFCIDDRNMEGQDVWLDLLPERLRYRLRVTTFSLKYDKNGDLRISAQPRVRSYRLPSKVETFDDGQLKKPVAFWM